MELRYLFSKDWSDGKLQFRDSCIGNINPQDWKDVPMVDAPASVNYKTEDKKYTWFECGCGCPNDDVCPLHNKKAHEIITDLKTRLALCEGQKQYNSDYASAIHNEDKSHIYALEERIINLNKRIELFVNEALGKAR